MGPLMLAAVCVFGLQRLGATPGVDALDDEEPLPRLHVAETPSLAREGLRRVRFREPALEGAFLRAQRLHLGGALLDRVIVST